jgi:hypothetical protein
MNVYLHNGNEGMNGPNTDAVATFIFDLVVEFMCEMILG